MVLSHYVPHFSASCFLTFFRNRHIHAIVSAYLGILVPTISKPRFSSVNQLGPLTLASLQRVYLTSQFETIIRENLNPRVKFDEVIAPTLRGLLLYSRFARRDAVLRASGKAPREPRHFQEDWNPVAHGDWDLLPTMYPGDFGD